MPDKTELLQQEHKRQEDRKLSENTSSDTSLLSAQQLSSAVQRDELLKQWKQAYGNEYTSQVTATITSQITRMNK